MKIRFTKTRMGPDPELNGNAGQTRIVPRAVGMKLVEEGSAVIEDLREKETTRAPRARIEKRAVPKDS